jgi:hypothetical protein
VLSVLTPAWLRRASQSCSLSWDAPKFEAAKLSVRYVGSSPPPPPGDNSAHGGARRRYTLTHNDLTGALLLSVGSEFNAEQVGGWCATAAAGGAERVRGRSARAARCGRACCHVCGARAVQARAAPRRAARAADRPPRPTRYTRFLRDEILAEWAAGALHVHCHVRGTADWWLAPRQLRGFIFRREMPLVLDTVRFADREFMSQHAGARAVAGAWQPAWPPETRVLERC